MNGVARILPLPRKEDGGALGDASVGMWETPRGTCVEMTVTAESAESTPSVNNAQPNDYVFIAKDAHSRTGRCLNAPGFRLAR